MGAMVFLCGDRRNLRITEGIRRFRRWAQISEKEPFTI